GARLEAVSNSGGYALAAHTVPFAAVLGDPIRAKRDLDHITGHRVSNFSTRLSKFGVQRAPPVATIHSWLGRSGIRTPS
ncbi:MAG TPA: hypothetical protein VFZ14_14685, partial [Burkholderiales bacterium]|nr:hypothetical protein [Burkholderiales bacterium]